MYLRFVSPLKYGESRRARDLHMGIFQAAFECRDNVDMPAWLHSELIKQIDWFADYLPSPDSRHFDYIHTREIHPDAICWFKGTAKRFVDRAWLLKALIEEAGLPMSAVYTRKPGRIRYQDKYQIVAHPLRTDLPRFG